MHMHANCMRGGQRTIGRSPFPSTMYIWNPVRSSGLVAGTFPHRPMVFKFHEVQSGFHSYCHWYPEAEISLKKLLHFILHRGFYFSPLVRDPLPIIFKCLYNAILDWGRFFPVTVQLTGQPGMLVCTACCCTAVGFVINQQVGEGWLLGPALLSTSLFDCSCANHLGLYWLLKAHHRLKQRGLRTRLQAGLCRLQSLAAPWPQVTTPLPPCRLAALCPVILRQ